MYAPDVSKGAPLLIKKKTIRFATNLARVLKHAEFLVYL
jgi:hypothetical protein